MKKIKLSAMMLCMTGCLAASAVLSPETTLTKARAGSSIEKTSRITQSSAERHHAQPLPDPGIRSLENGISAPKVPTMRTADASEANLFGSVLSDNSFVSITATNGISLSKLGTFPDVLNPNGGGVFIGDNKYIVCEYDASPYITANYVTLFSFDGETITKDSSTMFMDEEAWSATDMAYDPGSKTIYGYFTLNDDMPSFFGKLDSKYAPVKISNSINLVAMACDNSGALYAINVSGELLSVDKATGDTSKIGQTGVTPGSSGSAAFGADGKLYWANWSSSDGCRLYYVDTTGGSASLVGAMPDGKQIAGLCSYSNKIAAVPAAPTDAALDFEGDALSGKIRFTIPVNLANGTSGEGQASWSVATAGVTVQQGQAAYGSVVEAPVSVSAAGEYTFNIVISNENGSSPDAKLTGWIGPDNRNVLTPPFNYTFENESQLNDFTILNVNNDKKTWKFYQNRVKIEYNSSMAMDDWLITPPVLLEAGSLYEFSGLFSCWPDSEERFEVMLGTSPTSEAMTVTVIPKTTILTEFNKPETFTGKIKVSVSGKYFIGIHGCSDEDKNALFLHSFAMSAGKSAAAPGAPADLTVTPGANCALEAEISCKAPEADINNNAIDELAKLEILRDGEVIYTENNVTPGQQINYTDRSEDLTNGNHTYSVRAYNEAGVGDSAQAEVYIGVRVPAKPASASFRQTSAGEVKVTWDKVTADENGNAIPEEFIRYALIIVANGQSSIVKDDLTSTSYSYKLCEPDAPQDLYYYGVRAMTDAGFSDAALTDMLPVGKSYILPFRESFANAGVSHVWGTKRLSGVTTAWNIYPSQPSLPAQDGDNGFAAMSGSAPNDEAILSSGNIDVEGIAPELSFWYYKFGTECQNTIDLLIDSGDGELKSVLSKTLSGEQGWTKAKISLVPYIGKTIRIAFDGKIVTHTNISIDNIVVREAYENNLSVASFTVPAEFKPDTDYEITLDVVNNGSTKAENWKAELLLSGNVVATANGQTLNEDALATLKFPVRHNVTSPASLSYSARVVYDKDEDQSDNETAAQASSLLLNQWPAPTELTATAEGQDVSLSWAQPASPENAQITEGFEDWTHLSTTATDGWTLLNLDSALAGGFQGTPLEGVDNMAIGFFALDFTADPLNSNSTFTPKSGNKCMASMYGYDSSTGRAVANDDWLITPELDGSAQNVSFYAKSYSAEYSETFQVLYSTTDTKSESFTKIKEVANVPGDWTKYEYEIPEGAKYFAIRCVSMDAFLFMVDEVSYISAAGVDLELKGYNVYRDGARITDSPMSSLSFTDKGSSTNDHIYHVSAVYDRGESAPARVEYIGSNGVETITGADFRVYSDCGDIVIENAEGLQTVIMLADGKIIRNTVQHGPIGRYAVTPGLYLVGIGSHTVKVMVN